MTDGGWRSDWAPILDDLEDRHARAAAMGGDERLRRHRSAGKLDARERLRELFDPGTFREIGALVGSLDDPPVPSDAFVAGWGTVDGRPAVAGAEDFTVLGGSIGNGATDKRTRLCQLAAQEGVPLVLMLEGAGHRLTNPRAARRPNDLQALVELSGLVPVVCLVLGPSAGHSALAAPLADFVVMTPQASLFTAGPPLVRAALGEETTPIELGGPDVHVATSGVAHNRADDDVAAIAAARRYLSFFPSRRGGEPPPRRGPDTSGRRLDAILDVIPPNPRVPYRMVDVLTMLVDGGELLEVQPEFGASVRCALAHLGGTSVAIVANDPSVRAGTIDIDAADKAAHFLEVAGAFRLPVVFLADNPGVMAGRAAERAGTLRHVARMFVAQRRLDGPKLHVTLRKAFGFGSSVMAMNPYDRQTVTYCFPGATLAALPAAPAAASAKLDAAGQARVDAEQAGGALRAAAALGYDAVIDPRDLRLALLDGLRLARSRAAGSPPRPGL